MKSCFFLGHRDTPESIRAALDEAIERHITEYGVTEFFVGHYGRFDRMAQTALVQAKARHLEISIHLLIPFHPTERPVSAPDGFDGTFYPPGMESVPRQLAIIRANRYMIDHCDYLIAYVWHAASNTRELLEYAEKRVIAFENLAEMPNNADCLKISNSISRLHVNGNPNSN